MADLVIDTGDRSAGESASLVLEELRGRELSVGAADSFRLGVNYWPRRKAMYWWPEFDRGEVAEEFDVMASLGISVVRVFLLWDDWQPSSDSVSSERLRDLGVVLDLAAERDLGLDITFFTGHMSGPNWSPGWLLDASRDTRPLMSGRSSAVGELSTPGIGTCSTTRSPWTPSASSSRRWSGSTGTTPECGCGTWAMSPICSPTPEMH